MDSNAVRVCKPFLKWPGGKRWLCPAVLELVSGLKFRQYFEPFLGGGAVFFALQPARAVLSDVNPELMNVYEQVRSFPHKLIEELRNIPVTIESYDSMRSEDTKDAIRSAVRFLFLNRTAFGGMYRLNQKGRFNVPFGGGQRRPDPLWTTDLLLAASRGLQGAQLRCGDFEVTLRGARRGDLVFCDPTYTVTHNNNGFIRYNESNFRWADQQRLAAVCSHLRSRGVTTIVTNAFHGEVRRLYRDSVTYIVDRPSLLCPSPEKRRPTKEYLFLLRP
jgi:DNA adenine methylase